MVQTAATTTGQFAGFLRPTEAGEIFAEARKVSVAQQLARQIPVSPNGVEIAYTTQKPSASWVAEAGQKSTTSGGKALRKIAPKKLAAISVVSAETVRANPGGYIDDLRLDLAEAFALAFDAAALHGTNTPFGANNFISATTKSVALGTATVNNGGIYADLNAGLSLLVNDGKRLTGFAFDSLAEPIFNGAVDGNGRPLFLDSPTIDNAAILRAGRVLGRPAFIGEGVAKDPVLASVATGPRRSGVSSVASPTTSRPRRRSLSTASWSRCSRTTSSLFVPRPSTRGTSTTVLPS